MHPVIGGRANHFYYLTGSLIVLLLLIALSEQSLSALQTHFVRLAISGMLLIATLSVRDERRLFRISLGLVALIVILGILDIWLDRLATRVLTLLLLLAYLLGMAIQTFRKVLFSPGKIDIDRIVGAIAIYLLIGLIWAVVYVTIASVNRGAFNVDVGRVWLESLPEFVYFSFVSLTTLGFGDIAPAAPITKFVVYMEAIVGQLYLAIMVAGLVSIGFSNGPSGGAGAEARCPERDA